MAQHTAHRQIAVGEVCGMGVGWNMSCREKNVSSLLPDGGAVLVSPTCSRLVGLMAQRQFECSTKRTEGCADHESPCLFVIGSSGMP